MSDMYAIGLENNVKRLEAQRDALLDEVQYWKSMVLNPGALEERWAQLVAVTAERDALKAEVDRRIAEIAVARDNVLRVTYNGLTITEWKARCEASDRDRGNLAAALTAAKSSAGQAYVELSELRARVARAIDVCENGPAAWTVDIRRHIAAILEGDAE